MISVANGFPDHDLAAGIATSTRIAAGPPICRLAELDRLAEAQRRMGQNAERQQHTGLGERSERRRIWALQRGCVEGLRTGKRIHIADALDGGLDLLW